MVEVAAAPHHLGRDVASFVPPRGPRPDAGHVKKRQPLRGQLGQALPGCRARQRRGVRRHGRGRRGAGVVTQAWEQVREADLYKVKQAARTGRESQQKEEKKTAVLTQPGGDRSYPSCSRAALLNGYSVLGGIKGKSDVEMLCDGIGLRRLPSFILSNQVSASAKVENGG